MMEQNERAAAIQIGGETYELLLTTRATKEIAKRYGGLENLGTKLMKSENFEMALDEIIWLIALMANQSVLIYNLRHKDDPKPLLTEEEVELLTSPLELATYKDAIMEAMFRGTKRNIESEADPKNVPSGKRRGVVYPADLLCDGSPAALRGGSVADAFRVFAGLVGVPQAVYRDQQAQAGTVH